MKSKWVFPILFLLIICVVHSLSQGVGRFYYGTYGPGPATDFPAIKDSLKLNIAYDSNVDSSTIQEWIDHSLRGIVSNPHHDNSPYTWSAKSHYTLWEAEGYPGSYYHFTYDGGQLVSDESASGGQARKSSGPYTSRLIQWGPTYYQQAKDLYGQPVYYTAEFNLKLLCDLYTPSTAVCSIMVVDVLADSILKDSTLYKSDFAGGDYRTFLLEGYTLPANSKIDFQIYLFGTTDTVYFYVDYVKVYDVHGHELIDLKWHDQDIMDYVSQSWVHSTLPNGDTVVYRWYLCDEPNYVDLFDPGRYIDSLLRTQSTERVGFQAFNQPGTILEGEYLLRQNPTEYHVDIYPTRWYAPDSSGEGFQAGVDTLIMRLDQSKQAAMSTEKDLWVTVQAHYFGYKTDRPDTCACCTTSFSASEVNYPGWYCYHCKRPPKPKELRLQTFLALCYGAKSVLNFCYYSYNSYQEAYDDTVLMLGLYNHMKDKTTDRWCEIRDFTSPRVNVLGPILNELTWSGAGFHEDLAPITGSSIDSLKAAPEETLSTTYVEVGFFKDDADTDYFMLVNRQCLESEDQSVIAYLDSATLNGGKMWYVIDQYSHDTTFTGALDGKIPFTTHLEPGEGKLFKLAPFPGSAFHGTAQPLTWQGRHVKKRVFYYLDTSPKILPFV